MSSTALGTPSQERRFDLDWLRVLAFALLIPFHAGMPFTTWGWHIKNGATSMALQIPMEFMHHWRLPLLFMISGAAARLRRRRGAMFPKSSANTSSSGPSRLTACTRATHAASHCKTYASK